MSLILDLSHLERVVCDHTTGDEQARLRNVLDYLRDVLDLGLVLPYFPDVPDWVQYTAVDKSGLAYGFEEKPFQNGVLWRMGVEGRTIVLRPSPLYYWSKTLRRRVKT